VNAPWRARVFSAIITPWLPKSFGFCNPNNVNGKTTMNSKKKRILAVDDQASNTRLVKLYLERTNNYVVREENDPGAALSTAVEFLPHLILLDVLMPGLDGWDLAACFQANTKLKGVPIVFLTASITKDEVEAGGGRFWGYPFLAKPIVLTEMVACLKQHLGG
jgi:CheY-like chemotaxis protein